MLQLLGIEAIRFQRKIRGAHLILRLLRLRDLSILRSTLRTVNLPEFRGEALESFGSLVSLWKWLRSTFQIIYLIERKKVYGHCVVGMLGLYDLDMGNSAFLSAFLFHPGDRGQGYGQESVCLFLDFLEKAGVARSIYVEVLRGNLKSLRFFRKMGFKIQTAHWDPLLMAKSLDRRVGFYRSF